MFLSKTVKARDSGVRFEGGGTVAARPCHMEDSSVEFIYLQRLRRIDISGSQQASRAANCGAANRILPFAVLSDSAFTTCDACRKRVVLRARVPWIPCSSSIE